MAEQHTPAEPHRARSRAEIHGRRHPLLRGSTYAIVALLVLGIALGGLAYLKLSGNIDRLSVTRQLGTDRPSAETGAGSPINMLVMGSDTRTGTGNEEYGSEAVEYGNSSARSDTNLVVHISGDRKSVTVVSIPRDSMVKSPRDCKDPASTVESGVIRQYNQNYALGGGGADGAACVIKTIEGNTGVYINHFVVVDFAGFQQMVDALGGVEVCTPVAIDDPHAKAHIPAGRSRLDGKQALSYVRVRKTLGDGSDLGRIKRQQAFLASVAQEATKSSLLLRPDKLYRFLDAATKSMTMDDQMSLNKMRQVAQSVKGTGIDKIRFVTVPTEPYPADTNRVQWTKSADALWKSIAADEPLPGSKEAKTTAPTASPTTTQSLTVTPDKVQVSIVNDSGTGGLGTQASDALKVQGFNIVGVSNGSDASIKGATVMHAPADAEAARTVAAAFPGATVKEDATIGSGVVVHLGADAPNVVAVPNRLGSDPIPTPSVTVSTGSASITARAADEDICG
ncbi:MAG: LCP family protein [Micrococcales bacterium]|nr:LCP family protein [Micrococcales bacterium]